MSISTRWAVNISTMFTELPYRDRARAAADAGFSRIESWWPFEEPDPSASEIRDLVRALETSGTTVVAMNVYGGPAGFRGIASHPDRSAHFRRAVETMKIISSELGIGMFNTAFGEADPHREPAAQWRAGVEGLTFAASELADHGRVLIEPLSPLAAGGPENPIRTLDDAARLAGEIEALCGIRPGLLLDTFHLAVNGISPLAQFRSHAADVAHIQFADAPGRGAVGTGDVDFVGFTREIADDYRGAIALEYLPGGDTPSTLGKWRESVAPLLTD